MATKERSRQELNDELLETCRLKKHSVARILALLEAGADPNAKHLSGSTPLHWSATMGHAEACSMLIAAGANMETADKYGETPLHKAARYGRHEACSALVAAGADPTARNESGLLPEEATKNDAARDLLRAARESRELETAAAKPSEPTDQAGQGRRRRI